MTFSRIKNLPALAGGGLI